MKDNENLTSLVFYIQKKNLNIFINNFFSALSVVQELYQIFQILIQEVTEKYFAIFLVILAPPGSSTVYNIPVVSR